MKIDITNNILTQFSKHFDTGIIDSKIVFRREIGLGRIKLTKFPDGLELYDFEFNLKMPFQLESVNPNESEWLLLNINLSKKSVDKIVNNEQINIQKYLPSGILFYPANTKVSSISMPHTSYKVALIRVKKSYLNNYVEEELGSFDLGETAVIYEDLDKHMETLLTDALNRKCTKLKQHACALEFIGLFLDKLKKRSHEIHFENLHPDDIKGLFMASAHLRNPLGSSVPSIAELATITNMGTTKFKKTFKQVFGLPPIQYHQKIKLDYSKKELIAKNKIISEISYEIGYSHPSKFSTAFKKHFGTLPSKF